MRLGCKRKGIIGFLLIGIACTLLQGCQSSLKETVTIGEWINTIYERVDLSFQQETPYYLNISKESPYYVATQSLVEYGVIENQYALDPSQALTREWVAYTLVNLMHIPLSNDNTQIRDLRKTSFPKQISTSISFGLMTLDKNNCFSPKDTVEKEEAIALLDAAVQYMNEKTYDNSYANVIWDQSVPLKQVSPTAYNNQEDILVLQEINDLKEGEYISFSWNHNPFQKKIQKIVLMNQEYHLFLEDIQMEDMIESMDLESTFEVDFENAQIYEPGQSISSSYENTHLLSNFKTKNSFQINGFTVSYHVSSSGISASIKKKLERGGQVYANFDLNHVQPTVKWKMNDHKLEEAYFKVDFKSSEKFGFDRAYEKEYVGDFKDLKPSVFFQSILSQIKEKNEVAQATIPICTIQVPIPNAPLFFITMKLEVSISASGKAELAFSQVNQFGMEIQNGSMRTFSKMEPTSQAMMKANTQLLGDLLFGLSMDKVALCDFGIQTGAKANVTSQVHIYEEDNHQIETVDYPADLVTDYMQGHGDVLVCSDIKAHWILNFLLNSSKTMASRLGLTKNISIWTENNAPVFPGLNSHLENWHFVQSCTRKEREKRKDDLEIIETESIQLKKYSMILDSGENGSIVFRGLPKGYSLTDLIYSSSSPEIVSVSSTGTVKGLQEGSSIITIETKDHLYTIRCTVLVRSEKKS